MNISHEILVNQKKKLFTAIVQIKSNVQNIEC